MSAQNLLLLVVASVIAIGGLWYYFDSPEKEVVSLHSTTEETENSDAKDFSADERLSGDGSFEYLVGLNRNIKCEISEVSEDTKAAVAGTVYVSGDRLRADMEMEQGGSVYVSHLIKKENTLYSWTATPYGDYALKYDITLNTSVDGDGASLQNPVHYNCVPWSVDEDKFTLPSDMDFKTREEMMNAVPVAQ